MRPGEVVVDVTESGFNWPRVTGYPHTPGGNDDAKSGENVEIGQISAPYTGTEVVHGTVENSVVVVVYDMRTSISSA